MCWFLLHLCLKNDKFYGGTKVPFRHLCVNPLHPTRPFLAPNLIILIYSLLHFSELGTFGIFEFFHK